MANEGNKEKPEIPPELREALAARERLLGNPATADAIQQLVKSDDAMRAAMKEIAWGLGVGAGVQDLFKGYGASLGAMDVLKSLNLGAADVFKSLNLNAADGVYKQLAGAGTDAIYRQLQHIVSSSTERATRLGRLETALPPIEPPMHIDVPMESTEAVVLRSVRDDLRGLVEVMSATAENTAAQGTIAQAMLMAVQQLGEKTDAQLKESESLRAIITSGQASADRLGARILNWTRALLVFTAALALLALPVAVDAAIKVSRALGWLPSEP